MRALHRLALAVLVICSAGLALGVSAAASSQPVQVCPVCTDDVTGDAWVDGESPHPDASTVTVTAQRNGSATWVAALRWSDAAAAPDDEGGPGPP
jgi:hypothetical protein